MTPEFLSATEIHQLTGAARGPGQSAWLKEQDRDTRHACAASVLTSEDAHAACINAKAI